MKLGRVQSRYDPRTIQLDTYVAGLPTPPARELLETTAAWPMLANDQFNCCTSAAAGHMVHHWKAANQSELFLTDQDIIRAHAELTNDRLMECVSMLAALKYWRNTGIGDHRINSFVAARPQLPEPVKSIIHLFGSAYVGLDLPQFACAGDPQTWPTIPWCVPQDQPAAAVQPQSANGHCVTAIGYGPDGIYVVSWGLLKLMSWGFYQAYNAETYAVLSPDWVDENERCPTGFHFSKLRDDLRALNLHRPLGH